MAEATQATQDTLPHKVSIGVSRSEQKTEKLVLFMCPTAGITRVARHFSIAGTNRASIANTAVSYFLIVFASATVVVPRGVWRTGSINLTSHLTFKLEAGAHIISTNNESHYGTWNTPPARVACGGERAL